MSERLTKRDENGNAYYDWGCLNRNHWALGRHVDRLAAYEDTGLTPERIRELQNAFNILFESERQKQQENEQLKEQINTAKIGWDTYKTYSEQLEQQIAESNKIIETQRQEIEKLKATLADWKYNAKCDADHIAALTTDKDELVKVPKQAREAIKAAWSDGSANAAMDKASEALAAIDKAYYEKQGLCDACWAELHRKHKIFDERRRSENDG
jgi:chromosome segregation ATPase